MAPPFAIVLPMSKHTHYRLVLKGQVEFCSYIVVARSQIREGQMLVELSRYRKFHLIFS
jgi:hypothetical protein